MGASSSRDPTSLGHLLWLALGQDVPDLVPELTLRLERQARRQRRRWELALLGSGLSLGASFLVVAGHSPVAQGLWTVSATLLRAAAQMAGELPRSVPGTPQTGAAHLLLGVLSVTGAALGGILFRLVSQSSV